MQKTLDTLRMANGSAKRPGSRIFRTLARSVDTRLTIGNIHEERGGLASHAAEKCLLRSATLTASLRIVAGDNPGAETRSVGSFGRHHGEVRVLGQVRDQETVERGG